MMARVVFIGLALIAAALMATAAPVALAQEPPLVTVSTFVQREGDTIGDPITIFITLSHPPGAEIVLQPDALALGALESAVPQIVAEESPDPTRTTFALRTRAFVTGVLFVELPTLNVLVDGSPVELLPRIPPIEVVSVLPQDGSEVTLRPLKPAETIGGAPVSLAVVLGPIAALLGLVLVGTLWRRWRRAPLPALPEAPLDPAQAAGVELARIDDAGLLPAQIHEFSRRINDAVRGFLEDRYAVPARNLTASELPARLAAAGATAGTVRMVRNLSAETDAVAYAGAVPSAERAARLVDLARAIVDPLEQRTPATASIEANWSRSESDEPGPSNGKDS